jgi:hypothetical protein
MHQKKITFEMLRIGLATNFSTSVMRTIIGRYDMKAK